ncbi:hypothetical protein [Tessaracoccus lacteus]|uniref:PIN domain-containing protein n=1 Tax=Tessaracoccus lacteus TaxID=3041766 RepID=A0ABY8PW57_9ACTN|nr:hypothetical protein [Tessaracoccus sp. T21]WGT46680.1 hypothetical protein QH948_11105 [Tessaracoccus sp. T21]
MSTRKTLVFIDTSSLLDSCWKGDERHGQPITHDPRKEEAFWDGELARLATNGRLVLTARNYEELVKHSNSKFKRGLADRSKYILEKLAPLIKRGTFEVVGDSNDPFADAVLLSVALKFRTQSNLMFVTQDRALANDLQKVVSFESILPRGKTMEVCRVTGSGRLKSVNSAGRSAEAAGIAPRPVAAARPAAVTNEPPAKAWWERAQGGRS